MELKPLECDIYKAGKKIVPLARGIQLCPPCLEGWRKWARGNVPTASIDARGTALVRYVRGAQGGMGPHARKEQHAEA